MNNTESTIIDNIVNEYWRACELHTAWPSDIIHAVAIVAEESGEAVQAALQYTYEDGNMASVEKELIHTAATCLRALISIHKGDDNGNR